MKRIRNSITAEIQEEQCGIVAGKGTTYAVFMLRTLAERAKKIKTDLYLCFIDYCKALDKHTGIVKKMLKDKNIGEKDVGVIMRMYWEQNNHENVLVAKKQLSEWRRKRRIPENKARHMTGTCSVT